MEASSHDDIEAVRDKYINDTGYVNSWWDHTYEGTEWLVPYFEGR